MPFLCDFWPEPTVATTGHESPSVTSRMVTKYVNNIKNIEYKKGIQSKSKADYLG